VGKDTTEGDSGTDQSVEFFVTTDGELQVTRSDTLDLEILGRVAGEFENFGSQILQDGSDIDGGFGTNSHLVLSVVLEETLDSTAGELQASLCTVRLLVLRRRVLRARGFSTNAFAFASSHCNSCQRICGKGWFDIATRESWAATDGLIADASDVDRDVLVSGQGIKWVAGKMRRGRVQIVLDRRKNMQMTAKPFCDKRALAAIEGQQDFIISRLSRGRLVRIEMR